MRKRDLRTLARERARVPLAVEIECEGCGEQWLEASRRTMPLFFKCPACLRRLSVRVGLHEMEEGDPHHEA